MTRSEGTTLVKRSADTTLVDRSVDTTLARSVVTPPASVNSRTRLSTCSAVSASRPTGTSLTVTW